MQIFLLTTPLFGGGVEEGMKHISLSERYLLREFAKECFKWDQASHVIFFENKPCSLMCTYAFSPDESLRDLLQLDGWKTFQKYEHLFPHPNFIFQEDVWSSDGIQKIEVFLFNKRALRKCFDRYLPLFQEVIGPHCSYEWFLSELKAGKSVEDIIKHDQVLLGVLLGYGEESARAFENVIEKKLAWYFLRLDVYCGNSPQVCDECELFSVVFMGNPGSTEVQKLVSTYGEELNQFWEVYKRKDPLVLFLQGICEEKGDILQDTFISRRKTGIEFVTDVILVPFVITSQSQ